MSDARDPLTRLQAQLVDDHRHLATSVAKRFSRRYDRDDLEQVALLGMTEGAPGYDPERGPFAAWGFRTGMNKVLQHVNHETGGAKRQIATAQAVMTACELHEAPGLFAGEGPETQIEKLAVEAFTAYLLGRFRHEGQSTDPGQNPEALVERNELVRDLHEAIEALPDDARALIDCYFQDGDMRTFQRQQGVGYKVVRNLNTRTMRALHDDLVRRGWGDDGEGQATGT